ncbi:DMT family transporter [Tardiphaga alba]|uniref:DMT family transporter n=1 Tax=Tardiphaga alba TaxID=340268 RepID=A0ABX8A960_9BRAD|nr:DMT family transporter [Tardiphaga alba]QUS39802.1 DMT family transporter [Tardiphaga alba]
MSIPNSTDSRPRIASLGLLFLVVTSIGWGFNWPMTKLLLTEWPPLTGRGGAGVIGGAVLLGLALLRGESLRVPEGQWGRLIGLSMLNVFGWMALMSLALLWLPAGEAAVIAYTMPIWAAVLAWRILGETLSLRRIIAMLMAFSGIAALMLGDGVHITPQKLLGLAMAITGAFGFAGGTVLGKKYPLRLTLLASAGWQIVLGSLPVLLIGLVFETAHLQALTYVGWGTFAYVGLIGFCLAYVCWFAALTQLPASVAAIGTMAVPVIGVVGAAVMLHEPLGLVQIAALSFTLAGVALATKG